VVSVFRLLGENSTYLYIRSVFLSPIIHTKSHKNRIRSSYPNQSEPSQFSFRCFALLNYRLHRRVKLLVLVSSPLEFRVLFTLVTAAAAPSSHPLPTSTIHHRKREKRVEKKREKKKKKKKERKKKEREKRRKLSDLSLVELVFEISSESVLSSVQ
jgi:hypothetical protein